MEGQASHEDLRCITNGADIFSLAAKLRMAPASLESVQFSSVSLYGKGCTLVKRGARRPI